MLPPQHIVAAVHRHWSTRTGDAAPTVYPGTRFDVSSLDGWFELWVDAWSREPQRHVSPDRLMVAILVHCFSRHATDKLAAQRLADAARAALDGWTLTITDRTDPAPQTIGFLTLQESTLRDLSRNHAASGQERLQHIVVTIPALAHELTTP